MARPTPAIENAQSPPVIVDMSDLLDRLFEEYNDEMQKPPDSFTLKEYADKHDFTRGKAQGRILSMLKSGKLKRTKIGISFYYYAAE